MKFIKQTKFIIVCLVAVHTNKLIAMNQINDDQIDLKLASLQNQITQLKNQIKLQKTTKHSETKSLVSTNSVIAKLLSSGGATYSREQALLDSIKQRQTKPHQVYLGGKIEQVSTYNSDSINDSGAYNSSTEFLSKAKIGVLTRFSPWVSGFFSFQGSSNASSIAAKENYILINNGQTPLYLIAGSKYVDFGNFQRFAASIDPLNRVFWISNDVSQIEGGYYSSGLNVQVTAFNGSSKTNTNSNQIANNAETVYYQFNPTNELSFHLGGAYINAINETASLANSTSVVLTDNQRTAAFDFFGGGGITINSKNSLQYSAEYTQTRQINNRTSSAWLIASAYQAQLFSRVYQLFLNYSALNALTGHYNQYLIGLKSNIYGIRLGIDYALLTASEVKNDHLVELKLEYVF
ncbi:hypothetical protein L3V82_03055 [Thiotrichales bacterium 19S3-7]|nr:hypothetical protein [Thiotrichales bacterium 19S3-7]MCF6801148.1 hypothetical protein [Thiotrichales bacterium 19S3-11]